MYCSSVCGDDEIFVLEIKNTDCVLSIKRNKERKKERIVGCVGNGSV